MFTPKYLMVFDHDITLESFATILLHFDLVIVQLIKTKSFPVLYYGLEACTWRKSQFSSLNFVINSTFRKVFDTGRKMLWAFVLKCLTVYRRNRLLRCARLNF